MDVPSPLLQNKRKRGINRSLVQAKLRLHGNPAWFHSTLRRFTQSEESVENPKSPGLLVRCQPAFVRLRWWLSPIPLLSSHGQSESQSRIRLNRG